MDDKLKKEQTFSKRQKEYKDEKTRVFEEAHREYQKKLAEKRKRRIAKKI